LNIYEGLIGWMAWLVRVGASILKRGFGHTQGTWSSFSSFFARKKGFCFA